MRVLLCLVCVLLAVAPDAGAQSAAAAWPGGRQAAIALTYDDSLRSQVEVALPQLDAAVPAEAHQALIDYLKAREGEIWTATFKDVMTAHAERARWRCAPGGRRACAPAPSSESS